MKYVLLAATATGAALADDVAAQISRNVQLVAVAKPTSRDFNDIWAYVAPNGKEYALIGSEVGTHIYDCTNPRAPQLRGTIPSDRTGFRNVWRDIKTFGPYAYVVSEVHGGIQVIDLRNPDSPRKIRTVGASMWSNAHNIAMDLQQGLAYVIGTGTAGAHVFDVKSNPTNPRRIATMSTPYVHDMSAQHGYAYLAEQNGNRLWIHDVSNLPSAPLLARVPFPGRTIAHATWPSWDGKVCLTANEEANGPVGIFDITNKRAPRLLGTYHAGPSSSIPHNVFIYDRIGLISHYTEGVRFLDLSDPANHVEIGFYDTWTGPSRDYNGNWGVTLPVPSGHVYLSDIQRGLMIMRPRAVTVRYGRSAPGLNGETPTPHTFGASFLGNRHFRLDVRGARANTQAVLVLGAGRANIAVNGLPINVSPTNPSPIALPFSTNASGEGGVPTPVPNTPAFRGAKLNAMFYVRDAAARTGFAATRGLEFEVFAR